MEYVDGEDLAERAGRGPMSAPEAAWVGEEIGSFLERAHRFEAVLEETRVRGIIHGDIKPKNVRLNREGQLKVLDFGIAKGLSLTRKLTRNDFGSVSYMSPERLDTGDVDVHSDLWSVGVLLYELVAGRLPFEADTTQRLEALIRARQAPPPLPGTCPPALARIILKALAGDPRRRYQTRAASGPTCRPSSPGRRRAPIGSGWRWRTRTSERAGRRRPARPGSRKKRDGPRPGMVGPRAARRRRIDPGAPAPDPDATRRTAEAATLEATRRTVTVPPIPASHRTGTRAESAPGPNSAGQAAYHPPSRRARLAFGLVLLAALVIVLNEASVWSDARQLRVDVVTTQPGRAHELWDRYRALSSRSLLRVGVFGLRGPLREQLMAQADRVIADYRQDAPAVREAQWREAATLLTDVLHLDPSDRIATSRLRYCEGHLQRIDGETRKRKKLPATQPLHAAVDKFTEAARLDERWPDPYLGLARTYIYGLDDLDRGLDALNNAERRGYKPGNRELVQTGGRLPQPGGEIPPRRVRREGARPGEGLPGEGARGLQEGARPLRPGDGLRRGQHQHAAGPGADRRDRRGVSTRSPPPGFAISSAASSAGKPCASHTAPPPSARPWPRHPAAAGAESSCSPSWPRPSCR